ncbi:ribonuclease HI [Verrucomicrobiota bacterium]
MKNIINIYADGSCGAGDDMGAWACFIVTPVNRKLLYGIQCPTTISRMELMPIIEGLVWLRRRWAKTVKNLDVQIYSDSEYVIKTMSGMYEPKKNMDLWNGFIETSQGFNLSFKWYERNKLPYMELCDSVCSVMRRSVIDFMTTQFGDIKNVEKAIPHAVEATGGFNEK